MNNLLEVALSQEGYTHIRLETRSTGATRNHIYKDVAMNDLEVHYTLDALMEEWDYPRAGRVPSKMFQTEERGTGAMTRSRSKVPSPDE